MADKIQIRRDTAANWTSANPTLAQGEPGVETDTGYFKVGDGSTAWTSLAYWPPDGPETIYAITGTTPALDPGNGGIQTWTLSGNSTPTDSFAAGESIVLMIDDGTAYSITWPTMTWVNNAGSAPTLATTGYTVVTLWKVSTTLYGALVGNGT